MDAIRCDKRGRRMKIGPFDTCVKQLQNVATLFPRMSEEEQLEAVKILRQFTDVIAERFGPGSLDITDDGQNEPSSVVIVPLSPGEEVEDIDNRRLLDTHQEGVGLKVEDAVQHVLDVEDGMDDTEDYCNLVVTDPNGQEQVVLVRRDEVMVNEQGTLLLSNHHDSKHGIEHILSELTEELANCAESLPDIDCLPSSPKKRKIDAVSLIDQAALEQAALDQAGLDKAGLDQADLDQAALDQAGLDKAGLDQANLDQAALDKAGLDQADLDQAALDQASLDQAVPDQAGTALEEDTSVEDSDDLLIIEPRSPASSDPMLKDIVVESENAMDKSDDETKDQEAGDPDYVREQASPVKSDTEEDNSSNRVSKRRISNKKPSLKRPMRIALADTNAELLEESRPQTADDVPVKRKRGRPKGSLRGRKGPQKTTCDMCGKVVNNISNLAVHMRVHTGERPYKCQFCDDYFTTHGNRRRHEAAHLGEKKHACEVCGRCFLEKKSMVMHMRRHTGEKPHICEVCGQSFRQVTSLRVHSALHTGIKSHVCSTCGKAFVQKNALMLHMKRHSEGKSIPCTKCNKLFHKKEDMLAHMERHAGDMVFKCVLCSTDTYTKASLVRHMKSIHGESGGSSKFRCLPCKIVCTSKAELHDHVRSPTHIRTIKGLDHAKSISKLLQGGAQLEEVSVQDMDDLPQVKKELILDIDVQEDSDTGLYTVDFHSPEKQPSPAVQDSDIQDKLPKVLSKSGLPESIAAKIPGLSGVQNIILGDNEHRIIVLKDIPGKSK